jgi:hypothetical protein
VRQHKKKQSWCKFLFTQSQNVLQAGPSKKERQSALCGPKNCTST